MVLAAGYGLRMRPLTLLRAKPALPVLNRPLLHWTLERLARAGVRDVIVNAHHLPETIEKAVRSAKGLGLRLSTVREQDEILGTGGGPRAVRARLGKEPVLLVNGDVLFGMDLAALVRRHRVWGARATLALRPNPGGYSAVVCQPRTGRILSIAGRPSPAPVGIVSMFASVHVLDPALLEALPEGPSDSVLDLYIPMLARGEPVHGSRVFGAWYDFGRPSLYRDAQLQMLPRGRSLIDDTARVASPSVRRSVVGSRSRIGTGAVVEASVLWERATVERGARVARSILTAGAVVRKGERASGVIVMPAGAVLKDEGDAGGEVERHGDMAWVKVQ
jgi:NDP-sugar pyrophosphorylase family protein